MYAKQTRKLRFTKDCLMLRKVILNSLYYSGAQALLAPLTRGSGAIFMLHHVRNLKQSAFSPNHHLSTSPEFLDRMILRLKQQGIAFVTMDEAAERIQSPDKHEGSPPWAAITLDDGYRDNLLNAVPVFRRHQVPYLIYIAPGLVDGTSSLWWEDLERVIAKQKLIFVDLPGGRTEFDISTPDRKTKVYKDLFVYLLLEVDEQHQRQIVADLAKAYKVDTGAYLRDQVMDWSELQFLAKDTLCSLGAHTIGHYALAKLKEDEVRFEMDQSREIIRAETGVEAAHFAFPYGQAAVAGQREFEIARSCQFRTAVTTRHGVIYPEHKDHMMALPRVSVNGNHQSMHYITTLLSGVPTRVRNLGRKLDVA